jgi:uncharacterized membrane-anchored protein YitT (DUF2179 family)
MFVILLSLTVYDLKIALYTLISMWVGGRVVDAVIKGPNTNKSVMIISDQSERIAERILHELNRGVTFLQGEGAFSGQQKMVIKLHRQQF